MKVVLELHHNSKMLKKMTKLQWQTVQVVCICADVSQRDFCILKLFGGSLFYETVLRNISKITQIIIHLVYLIILFFC